MGDISFGTLNRDGTVTNTRVIKQSQVMKCPRSILVPEHYKADGSCLCKDPDHIAKVLAERQYRRKKYEEIIRRQVAERQKGGM